MPTVLITLIAHHDLKLVALAAFLCALSAFAGITLLNHARRTKGPMRYAWLAIAGFAVGFGVWATHFVGMLSFSAGMPTGYDVPETLLSLAIAVAITGAGLWFAVAGGRRSDMALGGAIVGIGIAAMHYTGMAALIIGGHIGWSPGLVAASILLGIVFGAAALVVGTHRRGLGWVAGGTGLLTLAVCAMHFIAIAAADFSRCHPTVKAGDQTPFWLSGAIALVSIIIIAFALGGIILDLRERQRNAREADRMRGLADAAVEGLLVCSGRTILAANASFLDLAGLTGKSAEGRDIAEFLPPRAFAEIISRPNTIIETEMTGFGGAGIPVEIILREVDFGGQTQHAVAVRDVSARKQAEQHIRFLAHHDALTGLPNRVSFNRQLTDEIAHARRLGQTFAVLCLDLDRFKEVNDLLGHPAGDALLQRVGKSLLQTLEGIGVAARLGGDEFAVLLPDVGSTVGAGRVAEAILDGFRRDNEIAGGGALISSSAGIAIFPEDAEDAEHLMSFADTALYRAKQDGRGIYRFYQAEMGAEVRHRRLVEHDLRHAISRNQLRLVYQPQVDIQSGDVTGFEALVRWQHPERGEVSPAMFVPVAEESGLIMQIGEWVLRVACAEAATWAAPLSIAVNVSAVQIHAPNFAQTVHEVLVQTGLSPLRLEIEITETALIRDMARAVTTLRQIKALGVRIAMDDFGTGYSSLANLRAFPFSKIKVDQSFIKSVDANAQSAAIVRAVLGLGTALDVPVIAEGVERAEELEFLRGADCRAVQGFLMSRPQDISRFQAIVSGTETVVRAEVDEQTRAVA